MHGRLPLETTGGGPCGQVNITSHKTHVMQRVGLMKQLPSRNRYSRVERYTRLKELLWYARDTQLNIETHPVKFVSQS